VINDHRFWCFSFLTLLNFPVTFDGSFLFFGALTGAITQKIRENENSGKYH